MNTSCYKSISDFGSNMYSPVNNPLTYCLGNDMDQRFLHGGHADTYGQSSKNCQLFMSQYCAKKWDAFCEIASKNPSKLYPNQLQNCNNSCGLADRKLTAGETLIYNTAATKYLIKMHNGEKKWQPFDPTVPSSPMICYWERTNCGQKVPEYAVDPSKIDDDIVMNKILANPVIALDILINIYNTMKRYKTLSKLQNTKLGLFYSSNPYFVTKGGLS